MVYVVSPRAFMQRAVTISSIKPMGRSLRSVCIRRFRLRSCRSPVRPAVTGPVSRCRTSRRRSAAGSRHAGSKSGWRGRLCSAVFKGTHRRRSGLGRLMKSRQCAPKRRRDRFREVKGCSSTAGRCLRPVARQVCPTDPLLIVCGADRAASRLPGSRESVPCRQFLCPLRTVSDRFVRL